MKEKREIVELVELCRRNDRVAQRKIFERYKGVMFSICKRYMRTSAEAEDALISGFTNAFLRLDSYNGSGTFGSWLKAIIVNNCINLHKQELRRNQVERMSEKEEFAEEPEIADRFSADELYEAINSLDERYRTVFNMIVVDGYKYAEVAECLDSKVEIIKTILYRAKQKLKIYLTETEKRKERYI